MASTQYSMTPLRSCVVRPSMGMEGNVMHRGLQCKDGTLAFNTPSPVVELNRAVAVAMADGPAAGLALVEALAAARELQGYRLLHATRADRLRRLGRGTQAGPCYTAAFALTDSNAERRFPAPRLAHVTAPS